MPFTPTPELDANPDVRIFFSGLLMLKPLENNQCEVFVHSSASRHYFTIEVRRKQAGQPDGIMMRHIGPLAFIQTEEDADPVHGMVIGKTPAGPTEGVKRFEPDAPQRGGQPDGLSLAIDLASEAFQNGNPLNPKTNTRILDVDPLAARPSILLTDGTLYTAAKTRPDLTITLQDANGADVRVLPSFASLIGADISLDDNPESAVSISWSQQGKPETLNLRKERGVYYEIYVVNDPLFENDSAPTETNPKHDEFREYYKVLHVPSDQQFRLNVEIPPGPSADRGSTRAPCMAIILGGG